MTFPDIEVEVHSHMYAQARSFISIIRFNPEVMTALLAERVRNTEGIVELQEVILHIELRSYMVLGAMPVERSFRAQLMLGNGSCFRKEHIARLHLVLHVLFGVRFHTQIDLSGPQRSLIFVPYGIGLRISLVVLCPHAEGLAVVVEMAVLMIEDIASAQAEIEVAFRVGMREVKAHVSLTECGQTPFGTMVRIDIKNRILGIIQVISEIQECVRVPQGTADISVVLTSRFKTRRLGEQRIKSCLRRHLRSEIGIMHLRRLYLSLHNSRLRSNFSCGLNYRLKIAFYGHRAVEGTVLLCEQGTAQQQG